MPRRTYHPTDRKRPTIPDQQAWGKIVRRILRDQKENQ